MKVYRDSILNMKQSWWSLLLGRGTTQPIGVITPVIHLFSAIHRGYTCYTLPETNELHLKIGLAAPKGNNRIPTIPLPCDQNLSVAHLSSDQNCGDLLYIGDDKLPRIYRDYFISHDIRIPMKNNQYFMVHVIRVSNVAHLTLVD